MRQADMVQIHGTTYGLRLDFKYMSDVKYMSACLTDEINAFIFL